MDKIVVHGSDGRILKGHSSDFSAHRPYFHLVTIQILFDSEKVWLENQKGVFFVKDFRGNSSHIDLHFWTASRDSGKHVMVKFRDGERMFGIVESDESNHTGFFIRPVDPFGNTTRAYVVNSFIDSVQISE